MLEYEDIFDQLNIMGYLKTIEMMPLVTEKVTERHCRKCRRWEKNKCSFLGEILNPDSCDCSWWKEKSSKIIKTKRCSKCGETKPIDKFYKDKSSNDGHQYKCSKCAIEYGKEWQKKK